MIKVITYGTFDLLHEGHINLLRNAKALGDYLVVGVTSENYDKYRGKLNVRQDIIERVNAVKNTGLVNEIIVEEYEGQKIDDIIKHNIDIFAIGSDWIGRFDYLNQYCQVKYLERTKGISSTQLRNEFCPLINMGIVGTGRIASRFLYETKFVSGINISGVYNIRQTSAKSFAEKYELDFYTDNFDEFLTKVNAVYIASPHLTHYEYVKRALLQNKHVLCEKPLVLSEAQAKELFELAASRNLILLEALKTLYCPGFQRLASIAKSGKIGRIVGVEATFTKLVPKNCRELDALQAGGSVTELASYPLLAIFKLLGVDYKTVHYTSLPDKKTGVDLFTKIDIGYPGAYAVAKVGIGVKSEGNMVISGTRGYVYVPSPWWKTSSFELCYEDANENEKHFYKFAGDGLRYEILEFIHRIETKTMNAANNELSIAMSKIIDGFRNGTSVTSIS